MKTNLKRQIGVVLIVLLLAAQAALAAPAAARKAWLYNRGWFRAQAGSTWLEKNPIGMFRFQEVSRTASCVQLYDASRKMTVRLDGSTMYWRTAGQQHWNYLYHGRWADTNKLPLDQDRGGVERGRLAGPDGRKSFPHLGREYEVLGPATATYNCIAWSIGVTNRWVWPGEKIQDFDRLYGQNGYRRISSRDYSLQPGVDKIVLYGKQKPDGSWSATHGARQLKDGSWSSKLGQWPLVRHLDPDDLDGNSYGRPLAVYVRPHRA
jgi:hypothetical protein